MATAPKKKRGEEKGERGSGMKDEKEEIKNFDTSINIGKNEELKRGEVDTDGHCLYNAVAYQQARINGEAETDVDKLRRKIIEKKNFGHWKREGKTTEGDIRKIKKAAKMGEGKKVSTRQGWGEVMTALFLAEELRLHLQIWQLLKGNEKERREGKKIQRARLIAEVNMQGEEEKKEAKRMARIIYVGNHYEELILQEEENYDPIWKKQKAQKKREQEKKRKEEKKEEEKKREENEKKKEEGEEKGEKEKKDNKEEGKEEGKEKWEKKEEEKKEEKEREKVGRRRKEKRKKGENERWEKKKEYRE